MSRIKYKYKDDLQVLRDYRRKLLLRNNEILMIDDVKVVTETETYGRKNNKTREVRYIEFTLYAYNHTGEWVGICTDEYVEQLSTYFDLSILIPNARREFRKLETALEAMKNKLEEITTPDIVKPIP